MTPRSPLKTAATLYLAGCLAVGAASPYLVKDVDPSTGSSSSDPLDIIVSGELAYLSVRDNFNGYHLAVTDGTAEGTGFLHPLAANHFAQAGNHIFYSGGGGIVKSDGSAAGTVVLKASANLGAELLTPMGGLVFFTAVDLAGRELWRSDGTEAGTWRIKDIRPGNEWSFPHDFTVVGDTLYFLADDGVNGIELWRSDGTEAGTRMVKAVVPPNTYPPDVSQLRRLGDKVVFRADDGINGPEIWISDGTEAGTRMIKAVEFNSNLFLTEDDLVVMGDALYFRGNDGVAGPELWRTDGTAAGTRMVKDLTSGASNPTPLAASGSRLFFMATSPTAGTEMWVSDGTAAGTFMLAETGAGTLGLNFTPTVEIDREISGDLFFFPATTGSNGLDLWRSDGTVAGTFRLMQMQTQADRNVPTLFRAYRNGILFAANDGVHGTEIWFSDGSVAGTRMVKDINSAPGNGLAPILFYGVAADDLLYFSGTERSNGTELWRSDGTEQGTWRVADIVPGTGSSAPILLTRVGDNIYFSATRGDTGGELWKSDGTPEGTVLVKDIYPGTRSSLLSSPVAFRGALHFVASNPNSGTELWRSDGSAEGTMLVKDTRPGSTSGIISGLTLAGDYLYFVSNTSTHGEELWRSDGTEAGTIMVKDIRPATLSASPFGLTAVGPDLYFAANNTTNGVELWRTDGTEAGTVLVQDIVPSFGSSISAGFATKAVGDRLFFVANDGIHGPELWVTDRSKGGASLVDIRPGTGGFGPLYFHAYEEKLYFTAQEADFQPAELWTSDGTTAGTRKVHPYQDGGPRSVIYSTSGAERFYFTSLSSDGSTRPLWRSDGTPAGTAPILSQFEGIPAYRIESRMIATRNKLFMRVSTAELGTELWALDLSPAFTVEYPAGSVLPATGAEIVWDLAKPEDQNGSRTFVIRNTGEYDLGPFRIELDPANRGGYQISTLEPAGTLLPEGSASFTVTRTGPAGGPPVKLRVASGVAEAGTVEVDLVQLLRVPELAWDPSTARLNRQTGLFELVLTLANPGNRPISGFRIDVSSLPPGVTLRGAGEDGGIVYPGTLAAGASVRIVLEFASSTRRLGDFAPQISATAISGNPGGDPAGGIAVDRIEVLADGNVLIEFPAVAGRRYRVEYSSDMVGWKVSPVVLDAVSNRVQWIDRGPPLTDVPPRQAGNRFYRVREASGE